MHTASRFEFAPPSQRQGLLRSLGLALLVHGLLLAALTWGVNWRSGDTHLSAEAELWAAVPEQAAPKRVEPPPPPPPEPKKQIVKREPPKVSDADIALEREKKRKAKQAEEDAKREREKLAREKLAREKKLAAEKKKKALEAKRQEEEEDRQREKLRQENLKRMTGLAGASGAADSTGTALKSAGPSSSYAGRIRARIKPNIVFTEELTTNPSAEVEVRTSPDGTIVGRKLVKSSGQKNWDEAVLKAIDKTESLPRDIDGTVHSPLIIAFRPHD
jgi:colicin import membrane protein